MEPGHFAVRSWISENTTEKELPSSLTIYDGGDKQGFLWISSTGKTNWVVFQVNYRLQQEDTSILEGCTLLHETQAPLHYFSIETYPMKLQQLGKQQYLFSLPQTKILMSLSEEPLFSPQASFQTLPLPQQLPRPSLVQQQLHAGPPLHAPPKSSSLMRVDGQLRSQNKNTLSTKLKASPSSNPNGHAQRLLQAPKKQGVSHLQSLPAHHSGHESSGSPPWLSLAQQSPYSRPPPEVEEESVGPT